MIDYNIDPNEPLVLLLGVLGPLVVHFFDLVFRDFSFSDRIVSVTSVPI